MDRNDTVAACIAAVVPGTCVVNFFVAQIERLRPYKYDNWIYRIDGLFGFQPSWAIGRFVLNNPFLRLVVGLSYNVLGFAIAGVLILYLGRKWPVMPQVKTWIYNFVLAPFVYLLIPVVGPAQAFSGFPWVTPGRVELVPRLIRSGCNCIPSVHFSSALLVCYFARKSTIGFGISIVYAVLTLLSTTGFGQHYLFDLVCAVPYTYMVWWLGHLRPRKPGD